VINEQFWGRAVRASRDSQESGALLNFVTTMSSLSHGLASILQTASLNQKKYAQADACDALESEPGSM